MRVRREHEPRRVLVPVDFSPAATRAARAAVRLSGRFSPYIELLHVIEIPPFIAPFPVTQLRGTPPMSLAEYARDRAAEAMKLLLADLAPDIEAAGRWGMTVTQHLDEGHPAQRIVEIAASEAFDLVVLASRTRPGRLPAGGVTCFVMRHVPCPVLALPPAIAA